MGLRHRSLAVEGVQFHPEALLTEHGHQLLQNFIKGASIMKQITIAEAIQRTVEHREVFHDEMLHVMRQIMRGELSPAQIAGFIIGLRVKKETIGEIAAAAQVMRELATPVEVDGRPPPGRHLRHRRRRRAYLQRVDLRGVRRRRGRREGGEAHGPLGVVVLGQRRSARGARRATSRLRRPRPGRRSTSSASASCSRPRTTRR